MCDWGIAQVFLTFATDAKGQTLYEKMVEKIFGHSRGALNIQVRDGLPYVTVTLPRHHPRAHKRTRHYSEPARTGEDAETTQHRGGQSCTHVPYSHSPPSWGKSRSSYRCC